MHFDRYGRHGYDASREPSPLAPGLGVLHAVLTIAT
jgi:hypothetical protein